METVIDFIFLGSNITVDGDYSHEIKRRFTPWKKSCDKPRQVLKGKDITLLTKVCLVKAMVFPVVMYGCEKLDHKEGSVLRNWCFWIGVLEKIFESPLDSKVKPVNPKGNQSWIFIEGLMLKLKPQYFGHLI